MLQFLTLIFCLVLLTTAPAHARTEGGDLLWQASVDVAGGRTFAIAATHGRVIVVGSRRDAAGNDDFRVQAVDAETGTPVWQDRVDLTGDGFFTLQASIVTDNERVIVSGGGTDATGQPLALVRAYVAKTGAIAWTDTWRGSSSAIAADGDRLIALVTLEDASGGSQFMLRAYRAKSGAPIWQKAISAPPGYSELQGGPLTLRGEIAFLASTVVRDPPASFTLECRVRALDARNGNLIWETIRPLHAPFGGCTARVIDADGHGVVIGGLGGIAFSDYFVFTLDADTGQLAWQDHSVIGANEGNYATAVDVEGRQTFVSGIQDWVDCACPTPSRTTSFLVRSYDTETGALRWEDRRSGPLGVDWLAFDLAVGNRRVFAVGENQVFNGSTFLGTWLVRAYDSTLGTLLWEDEFQVPNPLSGATGGRAVAVDDGRVFVAGAIFDSAGVLKVTIRAYDAR
jgi:outer membrane protein assembly factor BamB